MSLENLTFKGGTHVKEYKELSNYSTDVHSFVPEKVTIPLQQHIGAPCESLVAVGDMVKVGQKIGEAKSFVSAPVHASISGKVKAIESSLTASGNLVQSIVIENDGEDTLGYETMFRDYNDMSKEEILAVIKEAGITGLGGATFPTHVKLSPPDDKPIDAVIINAAECEPYVTCDEMNLTNVPEKVVAGLLIAMKTVDAEKGYIAIEDNKPHAQDAIRTVIKGHDNVELASMKTKYPQGDEKRIIDVVLNRTVPSGGLPMDVGAVVVNASTAVAIAEAVLENKPLYERVVTITGHAIAKPKNIRARIGTSYTDLIKECGGFSERPGKIIMGGPMMGKAQSSIDVPVEKGANGILAFTVAEAMPPVVTACIKCGKCVDVCPVGLEPVNIHQRVLKEAWEDAEQTHIFDCIECGSCSFICPAKRPLVETFRLGKAEIRRNRENVK